MSRRERGSPPGVYAPGMAVPPAQDAVPGYELLALLGRGGMGTVWRARDLRLGRDVALKLVAPGRPLVQARFEREGQLAAAVEHPGVVRVHATGTTPRGQPFLVCELVEGARTLGQAFAGADLRQRVEWIAEAAEALGAAHARGIVHRDVKPENLLVGADGRVKVADFGLATAFDLERLTQSGVIAGTPAYLAPEQVSGERSLGPPVDVWALGCVLYQALTDELPFSGGSLLELAGRISAGLSRPPRALVPHVPAALDASCVRALAPDPPARHPHAAALAAELRAWLEGRSAPAPPRPRAGRHLLAGGAAAGLALAGSIALLATRDTSPPPPSPPAAAQEPDLAALDAQALARLIDAPDPAQAREARIRLAAACRVEDPARALELLAPLEPRWRAPEERLPRLLLLLDVETAPALRQLRAELDPGARAELQARARRLLALEVAAGREERLEPLLVALEGAALQPHEIEPVLGLLFEGGRELVAISPEYQAELTARMSAFVALGAAALDPDGVPAARAPQSVITRRAITALGTHLRALPPALAGQASIAMLRLDMPAVVVAAEHLPAGDPLTALVQLARRGAAGERVPEARRQLRETRLLGPAWKASLLLGLQGEEDVREAVRLDPNNPELRLDAAWVCLELGDAARAAQQLRESAALLEQPDPSRSNFSRWTRLERVLDRLAEHDPAEAQALRELFFRLTLQRER